VYFSYTPCIILFLSAYFYFQFSLFKIFIPQSFKVIKCLSDFFIHTITLYPKALVYLNAPLTFSSESNFNSAFKYPLLKQFNRPCEFQMLQLSSLVTLYLTEGATL